MNYNSLPDGMFVSFYVVMSLGLANAILITFFAFIIYNLLQYPLEKALKPIVEKYLSQ